MRSSSKLDRDLLHSISPSSLAAYLRSHGWSSEDFEGGSIWTTAVEGGGPGIQLVVPKSQSMRSYASAVGDIVGLLAEAENRPEWMVIRAVRSAAAELRKSEPEEDLHITGSVVRLHRDGTMGPGEIGILGIVEGDADSRFRRVWLSLVEEDYNLATRAHQDGSLVSVRGNLRRRGNRSALENAYGFAVLAGED